MEGDFDTAAQVFNFKFEYLQNQGGGPLLVGDDVNILGVQLEDGYDFKAGDFCIFQILTRHYQTLQMEKL